MADDTSKKPSYPVIELPESVASSQESVVNFMVQQLVRHGRISPKHADRAACQVMTRERQSSTAIGSGAAMPHSKSEVPDVVGLIGRSPVPLPWQSSDGIPVSKVCLVLTPAEHPQRALEALHEAKEVLLGKSSDPAMSSG